MDQFEIEIDVTDGGRLLLRCPCRLAPLPDGAPGAFWRGIHYPLLDGGRIDVGASPPQRAMRHALLLGVEASWVLLQGSSADLQAAASALCTAGVEVVRTGRWLGEPVGEDAFDWFIRCDGALSPETVAAALPRAVGTMPEPDLAAEIAALQRRVVELLATQAELRGQLLEAASRTTVRLTADAALTEQLAASEAARQSAELRVAELEAQLAALPPPRPAAAPKRLEDEIAAALSALVPHVTLLRCSLQVLTGEFADRGSFYRAVAELPAEGGRPAGNRWKVMQRVTQWWERHVSTGQNDAGRLYARFDANARCWRLLLSWKGEQPRDVEWLAKLV